MGAAPIAFDDKITHDLRGRLQRSAGRSKTARPLSHILTSDPYLATKPLRSWTFSNAWQLWDFLMTHIMGLWDRPASFDSARAKV
jgi:hypothetical protein